MSRFPGHVSEALVVDRFHSSCGACGRGADPTEETHDTVIVYMAGQDPKPGCGVRWTKIASAYVGGNEQGVAKQLRPDLEWIELYPRAAA